MEMKERHHASGKHRTYIELSLSFEQSLREYKSHWVLHLLWFGL